MQSIQQQIQSFRRPFVLQTRDAILPFLFEFVALFAFALALAFRVLLVAILIVFKKFFQKTNKNESIWFKNSAWKIDAQIVEDESPLNSSDHKISKICCKTSVFTLHRYWATGRTHHWERNF
jgi:hypothetical protein